MIAVPALAEFRNCVCAFGPIIREEGWAASFPAVALSTKVAKAPLLMVKFALASVALFSKSAVLRLLTVIVALAADAELIHLLNVGALIWLLMVMLAAPLLEVSLNS